GLIVLATPLGCSADRDKAAKPDEDFQAIHKDFEKAMEAFEKELGAAKTPEEEKEIKEKFPGPAFAARFLAFAEKDPSTPEAFDALLIALGASGGPQNREGYWGKVMKVLQRDHVKNEKLGRLVR